ncbi:MAG: DUF1801 domain-containing protein [Candidatus Cohnella colombiensis]|uniref:DUF1801 domain-containing protein n=1 Tax=Candidatus Cohnella colombiensis TaxID=3121368 RepID=A0AA95EZU3_9BACL|nr:MAG: DUF1801 domain-containing protein [Cohnella sp.]
MKINRNSPENSIKRSKKLSDHEQVVEFLKNLEHPMKREIEEVRQIILNVNENITEHIKWNAPSFCFNNEDRVTFNLQGKSNIRLIFHTGAKVKEHTGKGPILEESNGLLEWVTYDRAIMKITSMSDVESKKEELTVIVARWIEATS